jgi:hypothetical protein
MECLKTIKLFVKMTAVFNDNVVTTATLPPPPLSKIENYGRGHSLNGCSPLA